MLQTVLVNFIYIHQLKNLRDDEVINNTTNISAYGSMDKHTITGVNRDSNINVCTIIGTQVLNEAIEFNGVSEITLANSISRNLCAEYKNGFWRSK